MFNLQKHQKDALEHITSRCANQRFTLLWHEMGTGKTLTGVSIAMSFPPTMKCTIIVPSDVLQPWHYHMDALKVPSSRVKLVAFESIKGSMKAPIDLNQHVVVVDEAHNIIVQLMKEKKDWDVNGFLRALKGASKVVFMTGTPVTSSVRGIADLAFLINIGAGKEILPFEKAKFESIFFKIPDRFRQIMLGKVVPMIQANPILTSVVTLLAILAVRPYGERMVRTTGIMMPLILASIATSYDQMLLRKSLWTLNVPKIRSHIRDIVLPFRIDKDPNYPSVKEHEKSVQYNRGQIQTLIRMMDDNIDTNVIRHMFGDKPEKILEDPKLLAAMSQDDFLARAVSVGNMYIDNQPPPKFSEIEKNLGKRSVVWSQHLADIKSFERYLHEADLRRKIGRVWKNMTNMEITSTLEAFKAGRLDVLLLHPDMYQGISIQGATDMHIMEPCIDAMKLAQARARVIRFKSHAHLPPSERRVQIFRWRCSYQRVTAFRLWINRATSGFLGRTNVQKETSKYVKEYKPYLHQARPDLKNAFTEVSPDDLLAFMDKSTDVMTDKIREDLTEHGSVCKTRPLKCCVWQPDRAMINKCIERTGLLECTSSSDAVSQQKGLNGGASRRKRGSS